MGDDLLPTCRAKSRYHRSPCSDIIQLPLGFWDLSDAKQCNLVFRAVAHRSAAIGTGMFELSGFYEINNGRFAVRAHHCLNVAESIVATPPC